LSSIIDISSTDTHKMFVAGLPKWKWSSSSNL